MSYFWKLKAGNEDLKIVISKSVFEKSASENTEKVII